jgi:hypothetical protein
VVRVGQAGVVVLRHPEGPGFVSLRSSTADERGAEQTVIRAYRIG